MIIGSHTKLEIGKTYYGIQRNVPGDTNFYNLPYVVLKEVTMQDWIDDYKDRFPHDNITIDSIEHCKKMKSSFYEVSTD